MLVIVVLSGSLVAQGLKKTFAKKCLACSYSVYHSGPLGGVARRLVTATTLLQDVNGGPLGDATSGFGNNRHLVDEDVDGGPPRGCYRWGWQRPPLSR
jgi:hypothetical protein